MKRIVRRILIGLAVVVVAVILILNFAGGTVIKNSVNAVGPVVMGVPVSLRDAELRLLRGYVRLDGMHVGNPEGFKTDGIFDLGRLDIDLDVKSLPTDTIHIRKILIRSPVITYERGLTSSNLGKLLEQLQGGEEKKGGEKTAEAPPAKSGKKVIIDEFTLAGAQLHVSITAAGGHSAILPLPPITLHDLGKESDGASFSEVIGKVVSAVAGSVTTVISGAGKLVGEGAQMVGEGAAAVGEGALHGAQAVGGAAADGAAAVGGAAVDGAKAVGEGAAAVGGAVAGGAKAAGGAVVGGASKVVSGIGSLFGGSDKTNEPAKEAPAGE